MPAYPSSRRITRRRVAAAATAAAATATAATASFGLAHASARAQGATPATDATPLPGNDPLDAVMQEVMANWALPGAQLAVGFEGRLVMNRAFGLADVQTGEATTTDHRFRIASVSKTITAVGVLRLVQSGQLALDDAVFPLLALEPPPGAVIDPMLDTITVEHLLTHSGGWDSGASGDPQYLPLSQLAAATLGEPGPPSGETIIRFMLGSPLDFAPGTEASYSNFGFNILGRVIERVSGMTYAEFIQKEVFGPAGITDMQLGGTAVEERAEREVRYEQPPEYPATVPSVYPGVGYVPFAYGSFFMDAMDAHGGWIGTASDLVRYALAIDGARGDALLEPGTIATLLEAPHAPFRGFNGAANTEPGTGLGWVVQPGPLGNEWSHTGALGGSTAALLVRNDEGLAIAFVTNTLPADFLTFFDELRTSVTEAAAGMTAWPDTDLFEG